MSEAVKETRQQLGTTIRDWIHMDNLVENHLAQAANAREIRTKHEMESIALIKQLGLDKSTIRVSGAMLSLQKKATPAALSWGYLEKEIPVWATRSGVTVAQSASLIKWLHDKRETKEVEFLKKGPMQRPKVGGPV
jgi:hypothetical protein